MTKPKHLKILFTNSIILIVLLGLILIPRPVAGYIFLGQAGRYEEIGSYASAAGAYASAANRLPWLPSLWEKAGLISQKDANQPDTITYLKRAVTRNAISKKGWLSLGIAYQQTGDLGSAVYAWEQARPLAEAYLHLGEARRAAGNYPAAIESWHAYIQQAPLDASAHYQLGLLLMATAPQNALPELMQADQIDPSLDASVQDLRTALNSGSLSDDSAYQFLLAGRALGASGNWDLAAEAFQNAIDVRADYADAWAWLSEAEQQRGLDGSFEMDRALALNADSAMLQSLYGLYLQRKGEPGKALDAFQKAATLEPQNSGWQMALGSAYEQTGDLVSALVHYQKATELSPQEAIVWQALAQFSLRNGVDPIGTGLPAALKLEQLASNDWLSDDIAGQILLETGDPLGAEILLKKALALDPTQPAPSLHLGLLYLQTGNRAGAYSYLNQASTFDPDGTYGWQAKRLLEQYFP